MKMYDDKKQLLHQIDSKFFRIKRQFYERFTTPGKSLSFVLKKKYIEDVIKKAIFNGTTQFIKFFSGFDLLFWELSSTFPDVTFIEIDQHHFISKKKEFCANRYHQRNYFLKNASSKFEQNFRVIKKCKMFDVNSKTYVLYEDCFQFLKPREVVGLLTHLGNFFRVGTRLVFDSVPSCNSPNNNMAILFSLYEKNIRKTYGWTIEFADLPYFLAVNGFKPIEIVNVLTLKKRYLPEIRQPLYLGINVVISEIMCNRGRNL